MRPLIVGNWKMHGLMRQLGEIEQIAISVKRKSPNADVLVCPPTTLLALAVRVTDGLIAIGAQNCHHEIDGAFTGDVSAEMLKDAGAAAVIVGHSERRQNHGETDSIVLEKAKAARRAGLLAIICVGETQAQRQDGKALSVCADQIAGSVPDDSTAEAISIAYEPLWAIGTGRTPTAQEIAEVHAHIRQVLERQLGVEGGQVRILYGGSVNASNAQELLEIPEVGGALVGGVSLEIANFEAVFMAATAKNII